MKTFRMVTGKSVPEAIKPCVNAKNRGKSRFTPVFRGEMNLLAPPSDCTKEPHRALSKENVKSFRIIPGKSVPEAIRPCGNAKNKKIALFARFSRGNEFFSAP